MPIPKVCPMNLNDSEEIIKLQLYKPAFVFINQFFKCGSGATHKHILV